MPEMRGSESHPSLPETAFSTPVHCKEASYTDCSKWFGVHFLNYTIPSCVTGETIKFDHLARIQHLATWALVRRQRYVLYEGGLRFKIIALKTFNS